MIPQIDNSIDDNNLVNEVILPSRTYKLSSNYETQIKYGETQNAVGEIISLSDAAEVKLKKLDIFGNLKQAGTPSPSSPVDVNVVSGSNVINISNKNIFNYNQWLEHKQEWDNEYVTITKNYIISIMANRNDMSSRTPPMTTSPSNNDIEYLKWMSFPVESDTDYTIILKNENLCTMQILRFFYKENYSYINVAQADFSSEYALFTFKTTSDTKFVSFRFDNESYSTGAKILKISEIQLLKGIYTISNMPNYEPHQDKEFHLDLPVENLFKLEDASSLYWGVNYSISKSELLLDGTTNGADKYIYNNTSNYITLKAGTYTISSYKLEGSYKYTGDIAINLRNVDNNTIYIAISKNTNYTQSKVITLTEDTNIYLQIYTNASGNILNNLKIGFQIEKGSKSNAYTPYGTEQIELCKIGDYQDYFYKSGSKWYLHKEIGKTIFNGSESWSYSSGNLVFYTDVLTLSRTNSNLFCNRFSKVANTTTYANMNTGEIKYDGAGSRRIIIKYTNYTSVTDFKTWLASNNTTVYYPLATAIDTEITDTTLISQLEDLQKAKAYQGTTYISTIANEIGPILDIDYYPLSSIYYETAQVDRISGFIDDKDAIKQAVYHILSIERYSYLIYDDNYGVELQQYIGQDFEYLKVTIQKTLEEALMQDERIISIEVIDIEKIDNETANVKLLIQANVGEIQMEVNINV